LQKANLAKSQLVEITWIFHLHLQAQLGSALAMLDRKRRIVKGVLVAQTICLPNRLALGWEIMTKRGVTLQPLVM
jgi:hypothetical protein